MSIVVPILGTKDLPQIETSTQETEAFRLLSEMLARRFVRREQRFYHVDHTDQALSRRDIEQLFLYQVKDIELDTPITAEIMKRVFNYCIDIKHSDEARSIPVWGGELVCQPGTRNRIIRLDTGSVAINTWTYPVYRMFRNLQPNGGVFDSFFQCLFPREEEKNRVLDWLAWSLQHENDKPAWAILLYSRRKGTGKSTFCDIARRLFGEENTATQNNVDKLTSRFNSVALTSRLVISEELNLGPESAQSNALKTFITDRHILAERKGREPVRVPLISSFIFTTNHLPVWIEALERRYYIVATEHEGHAAGPKTKEFTELVGQVRAALEDDRCVGQLYNSLMNRKLGLDFDAKTLNVQEHATDLMRRLQATDRQVNVDLLEEYLNHKGRVVVTLKEVRDFLTREFKVNGNATGHLLTDLGWTSFRVKWGGIDYSRVIWAKEGYTIADGNIIAPDGSVEAVCDYLALKDDI